MALPKATKVFHFTNDLDTLKNILLTYGFYPKYSLEDTSWLDINGWESMAFPMVCFCDIPISRISAHVKTYGRYGLGMSKEWAIKKGLNPVFYISAHAPISKSIFQAVQEGTKADKLRAKKDKKFVKPLNFLLSHSKPLSGEIKTNDGFIEIKDFYQENEWRYVPMIDGIPILISKDRYNDRHEIKRLNNLLKNNATLTFKSSDVRYLFVKREEDISPLIEFIDSQLTSSSLPSKRILMSRIISLRDIQRDA
jgi:hypothetical protein